MPRNASPRTPWPPTKSNKPLVKIIPIRIVAENKPDLPSARPMFDVPLGLLCGEDVVVPLGVDEAMQAVPHREPLRGPRSVFPKRPLEIGRGPDIERAIRPVGHDVDPTARRHGDV